MFLRVHHLTGIGNFSYHGRLFGHISKGALEGSSDTNPREISPHVGTNVPTNILAFSIPFQKLERNRHHVVLTLDPNKFAEKKQQRFHIGNLQAFIPFVSLLKQSSPVSVSRIDYEHNGRMRLPYPPDTKAFLYYSMPPGNPRISGELRLRLTSSDDPASFASGSDLLRTNDRPWFRPLYGLPNSYFPLYEKLREEQFVPEDLHTILSTLPSVKLRYSRSRLFYTLNDTFIVDFSHYKFDLIVITEQGAEKLHLYELFSDGRSMFKALPGPYTGAYTNHHFSHIDYSHEFVGSALVRFERSTLPDHKGTRTVVLRFLKIITPVKCVVPNYDGYISYPKEGELYQRASKHNGKLNHKVWSVNIDKPLSKFETYMQRGLQLLWDT